MYPNQNQLLLDLYASSINPSFGFHMEETFDETLHATHREVWERLQWDNSKEEEKSSEGT